MSESGIKKLSQERTREWLASQEDEELESIAESSVVDSLDYDYTEEEEDADQNTSEEISTMTLGTQIGA